MLRVPISFAMLLSTLGCALINGTNLTVIVQQMISQGWKHEGVAWCERTFEGR